MPSISSNTLRKVHQPRRRTKSRCPVYLLCLALVVLFAGQAASSPAFSQALYPVNQQQSLAQLTAVTPDPLVRGMINQVKSTTLHNYVAGLSGKYTVTIGGASFTLLTRYTSNDMYIEKATQYAYEHFQALGLAVSYHTYSYSGEPRRNVVAEQPGTDPNCLYLLTAHLDSISPTPDTLAPGADDNASGSTGVLVAADIFRQYQFTCTLRYVLFSGEEQGLLGSKAYAQYVASLGDPILGVLNLDMIAYNTPGSAATIEMDVRSGETGNPDRVLSTMMEDVIEVYQIDLTPLIVESDYADSDHWSFWNAGYPAVLVIEDWDDHTPYYHRTTDTVDTLNMVYFTDYVRAIVGAMAHLGQVVMPELDFDLFLPVVRR